MTYTSLSSDLSQYAPPFGQLCHFTVCLGVDYPPALLAWKLKIRPDLVVIVYRQSAKAEREQIGGNQLRSRKAAGNRKVESWHLRTDFIHYVYLCLEAFCNIQLIACICIHVCVWSTSEYTFTPDSRESLQASQTPGPNVQVGCEAYSQTLVFLRTTWCDLVVSCCLLWQKRHVIIWLMEFRFQFPMQSLRAE